MPSETDRSPAAELLRRAVQDPARAARTLERAAGWDVSSASLAEIALLGAPANGFSPQVGTLSGSQWQQLQSALVQHISKGKQP